jgi:hypothetical protein
MDEFTEIVRANGIEALLVEALIDAGDPCPFGEGS